MINRTVTRCSGAVSEIPCKGAGPERFSRRCNGRIGKQIGKRLAGRQFGKIKIEVGFIVPYLDTQEGRVTDIAGGGIDGNQSYGIAADIEIGVNYLRRSG